MPLEKLTSWHNPRIKELVRLREKRPKDKSGLTVIEGWREVTLAIEANISFKHIFICRELLKNDEYEDIKQRLLDLNIPLVEVAEDIFQKISYGNRREGIIAVGEVKSLPLEGFQVNRHCVFLVLDGIEKPGNVGAILRTADAAGVTAVILTSEKIDIDNPNMIRSSLGTVFTVKVFKADSAQAVKFFKQNQVSIYAATLKAKDPYTQMSFNKPLAIVLGSEDGGLTRVWLDNADYQIKIPMRGKVDSLNVSTSAAILLYEALREEIKKDI